MPLEKRLLVTKVSPTSNGQLNVEFRPSIVDTDNNNAIVSQEQPHNGVCEPFTPIDEFIAARCGPLIAQGYQVQEDEGKSRLDQLVASEHTLERAQARKTAVLDGIATRTQSSQQMPALGSVASSNPTQQSLLSRLAFWSR